MSKKTTHTIRFIILFVITLGVLGFLFILTAFDQDSAIGSNPTLNRVREFIPFGNQTPLSGPESEDTTNQSADPDTPITESGDDRVQVPPFVERLVQLTDYPVAGYNPVTDDQLGRIITVTRGNGFLRGIDPNSGEDTIISDSFIPDVHDALISDSGKEVLLRFRDGEQVFLGRVPEPDRLPENVCVSDRTIFTQSESVTEAIENQIIRDLRFTLEKSLETNIENLEELLTAFQSQSNLQETGTINIATITSLKRECDSRFARLERDLLNPVDLRGETLDLVIKDFAQSPEGDEYFYVLNQEGSAIGFTSDFTSNTPEQVLVSSFPQWLPDYSADGLVFLTAKASGEANGSVYQLDTSNQQFTPIMTNRIGLTTKTKPSADTMLFSLGGRSLNLQTYDLETLETLDLGLRTLPEKCVFTSGTIAYCGVPSNFRVGLYPDDWYQGRVAFRDELWEIDLLTGNTIRFDPLRDNVDMTNLRLSPDESDLYFIDNTTQTLWKYDLD